MKIRSIGSWQLAVVLDGSVFTFYWGRDLQSLRDATYYFCLWLWQLVLR